VVRGALLVAVAALAALACRSRDATGACSGKDPATFTLVAPAAAHPPPAPALAGPVVRAVHVADFGDATCQQRAVAAALAAERGRAPLDVVVAVGDNLYECGPDVSRAGPGACAFGPDGATVAPGASPPEDPSFARLHETPLAALRGVPVHLALGNHDVATWGSCRPEGDPAAVARLKACLEVAHASDLWSMPARHYAIDLGRARLVVIDSNLAKGDYGGFTLDDEVAFVARAASAEACPPDRACFLVAHHPAATAGEHVDDFTPAFRARMERLVAAGGGRLRAWLAGHDHDLQHVRAPSGLDVLVSGNGSRQRPRERFERAEPPGAEVLFASVRWGYGVLEVGADGWRYRFVAADGAPLHCCAARGAGRCEPAACP
jgi:tartrate-resistant acid phosphatase type 5